MQHNKPIKIATINDACKKYQDKYALIDVSLDIYQGEVLSILGPNGAGKTTLINMMLGRLSLTKGSISIFGCQPGTIELKRQCGAMLQVSGLPDMSTVKEHIELFQSYYTEPMPYEKIIKLAGLRDIQNQYSKNLSGGQKQRLLFALSICGNPRLLFLDEPSVGMDIEARKSLWKTVIELKNQGTSIVLTTHYLEEADQLSDRIIMLNKGRIIQQGTPEEIKSSINCRKIRFISPVSIDKFINLQPEHAIKSSGKYYEIQSSDTAQTMKQIFAITDDISDLSITVAALEDAFLLLNKESEQ